MNIGTIITTGSGMNVNKIIIAGGRDFGNYKLLEEYVNKMTANLDDFVIVSGGARGADELGERYAKENGNDLIVIPAEWGIYGNRAGPIRNGEMAKVADMLIAFWDGKSRGTSNMINIMDELHKPVRVCKYLVV